MQVSSTSDHGITHQTLDPDKVLYTAIVVMVALAWYNVIELNVLILKSLKRYGGLYFWTLTISSWGTAAHALGFVQKFFPTGCNIYLSVSIITVGWYCMVTGQSLVLFSRIHLVVHNAKVLRGILMMIIIDAILLHIPTTILTFGANIPSSQSRVFILPYKIMEKLQMTAFSAQEIAISTVYATAAIKLFRPLYPRGASRPIVELVLINLIIIAMDIALLGFEYASFYTVEVVLKSLVYSVKLKLEFAVLTELKNYTVTVHGLTQEHREASGRIARTNFDAVAYPRSTELSTHQTPRSGHGSRMGRSADVGEERVRARSHDSTRRMTVSADSDPESYAGSGDLSPASPSIVDVRVY